MSETGQFAMATEIANKIVESCDNQAEAQKVLDLVKKLLDLRWSISRPKS
jgi:hypothetical protein